MWMFNFGAFQKMIVLFWCFSNGQKKINACDQCFFYIVDQKLEVKYHRYLTGSLFKKVTKTLDMGEIQIFFPDGIICG